MRLLVLLVAVAAPSCSSAQEIVRARFAAEHRCRSFVVESLARRAYRVTGCGVVAVYSCASPAPGEEVCERVTAPPPPTQPPPPPSYPWPPSDGRIYQHFDEFERFTVVQTDMTIGTRVLRIFGAPRRGVDDVFLDVVVPMGPPPGPNCTDLLLLVGEEVVRLRATATLSGASGEPLVRFQAPVLALDRGIGRGVVKIRFCGVDVQLSETQVAALRVFLERFRDVARTEPPRPPEPSPATASPDPQ